MSSADSSEGITGSLLTTAGLDRLLLDHVPDIVLVIDPEGKIVEANRSAHSVLGYDGGALVGRPAVDLVAPEHADAARLKLQHLLSGKVDSSLEELVLVTRDGARVPIEVSSTAVIQDGSVVAALCICRDLTTRRTMEAALQESEARLLDAFEQSAIGMAVVSPELRFLQVNRALCALTGYEREELVGMSTTELTHPDDRDRYLAEMQTMIDSGERTAQWEKRLLHRDGRVMWVRVTASLVGDAAGEPLHVVAQLEDVTGQVLAHEALERSEALLAEAQRISHMGSWEWDVSTDTVTWSEELYRIYGLDHTTFVATYEGFLDRVHLDDRAAVRERVGRAVESGRAYEGRHRLVRPDGTVRVIESRGRAFAGDDGRIVRLAGTAQDVTEEHEANEERRLLRAELVHVHKMEAIGILAGGVAHDFNNALTAIRGYAELVLSELDPASPAWADADALRRVAEHAASLPRQLLAFARRQTLQPRELDLGALVQESEGLLQHVLGPASTLELERGREAAWVLCDPGQLQLVLVNLALNAKDAMPDGGRFTVRTGIAQLDEQQAETRGLAAGRYATLAASDTGRGMDEATRAQALEPFFTTKPPGEGTGLGLATVYGIVTQSGGAISIESEPGLGTKAEILLPAISEAPRDADEGKREASPGAGLSILLVEDEPAVLGVAERTLRRAGYEVLAAGSAATALSQLDAYEGTIDVLVTDVRLPDTDGTELAQIVQGRLPGVSILYVSGYTDDVLEPGRAGFLAKPFSPAELVAAVESALAATPR